MRPIRTTVQRLLRSLARLLAPVVLLVALAAHAPGCAAPTLPLPPPTALLSTPDENGIVTITGTARPSALVFALVEERGDGVIIEADGAGSFTLRIAASIGETITVWQMVGSDTSQLLTRTVPDR